MFTVDAANIEQVFFVVNQILTGDNSSWLPNAAFTYRFLPETTDAPMPHGSSPEGHFFTITGDGSFRIGPINFAATGIYVYTLNCITHEIYGFTTDRRIYTIKVHVTSDLQATTVIYNDDNAKVPYMRFEHIYNIRPGQPGNISDRPVINPPVILDTPESILPDDPSLPEPPEKTEPSEIPIEPDIQEELGMSEEPEMQDEPETQDKQTPLDITGGSPKTGDFNNPTLWIIRMSIAGTSLVLVIFASWKLRRRRSC